MGFENHIISLFGLAASWFLVTGLIWKLFDRIEKVATDEAKEKTNTWLHNVNPGERLHYLSDMFGNSFDSVFGEKHLSWKCFFRSGVASVLSAIAVLFFWVGLNPVEGENFIKGFDSKMIITFAVVVGIINLIPDYISLLQSRLVVKYNKDNNKNAMILVIVDFLLTVVIATFTWVLLFFIVGQSSSYDIRNDVLSIDFIAWKQREISSRNSLLFHFLYFYMVVVVFGVWRIISICQFSKKHF